MNKYILKPKLATVKQAFFLEDEKGNMVYEGKMTKFSLFGASVIYSMRSNARLRISLSGESCRLPNTNHLLRNSFNKYGEKQNV